jgi:hypothetical protein
MKIQAVSIICLIALTLSSCSVLFGSPTQATPPTSTELPPSQTPWETQTPAPTATMPPPTATVTATATPIPQPLLLRGACGTEYAVRTGESIEIFYGGWGVLGYDLAQQWATAITVQLTIDGLLVEGQQLPPSTDLPYNCLPESSGDIYWVYSRTLVSELSPGLHIVTVTMQALRAIPDGAGRFYGPGLIGYTKFEIMAQ